MGALVAVRLTQTLVEKMVTKIEKLTFWSDTHSPTLDPPDKLHLQSFCRQAGI